MAYRRRQGGGGGGGDGGGMSRSTTFKEEKTDGRGDWAAGAAQGGGPTYDYTSMGSTNETVSFWGVLARKAKSILEDDFSMRHSSSQTPPRPTTIDHHHHHPSPHHHYSYSPMTTSSASASPGKTFEVVRKDEVHAYAPQQSPSHRPLQTKTPATQDELLKASRDVAMATAAKAKLLLRELKTIRAELAFSKQRCSQLEEENRILREAREEKGHYPTDDDMIRRQLEALLVEKSRLAQENSVYASENRVLREIVEYHQMASQDVIYFDEGADEDYDQLFSSFSMPHSPISSPPPPYLYRTASAHVPRH